MVEESVTEFYKDGRHKTTGVIVPSYTMINDYARQKTKSQFSLTVGMCLAEIINNKTYDLHWLYKTFDTRTKEAI
jgi:hypothetical protein